MIARVTTFGGPADAHEQAIRVYEEEVIPWLRDVEGFRGVLVLIDREAEKVLALTFWEDADAAQASSQATTRFRELVTKAVGTTSLSVESYEIRLTAGLTLGPGS
jgi:heme-degrading monooxygenase HmoA